MAESYVVDMRHYTDVDWSLVRDPDPLQRIIAYFGSVVEAATASSCGGSPWHSALPCPRRPERKSCGGRFVVTRQDVPPRIDWECPRCGEMGIVTGWWGTEWDLTAFRPREVGAIHCALPAAEHGALLAEVLLEDELRAVLRAGEWQEDDTVLVRGARADWELLVDHAAALANHCEGPTRRRRLQRAVDRLDEAGRVP